MRGKSQKYSLTRLLIENNEEERSLQDVYEEDKPMFNQIDHNKAIEDPELQAWKVKNKKFFVENANHDWFKGTFNFVHFLGHIGGNPVEQLGRTLDKMAPLDQWTYDSMSAFGFKKSGGLELIADTKHKIGLLLEPHRIGYAAMTDMWTEEHSSLQGAQGRATVRQYMQRYKNAMGIPKRPGLFDSQMAFKNQETYDIVINDENFTGDPNVIPEVICNRWKLKKILVPVGFSGLSKIHKLVESYNYDGEALIQEY